MFIKPNNSLSIRIKTQYSVYFWNSKKLEKQLSFTSSSSSFIFGEGFLILLSIALTNTFFNKIIQKPAYDNLGSKQGQNLKQNKSRQAAR